jgi:hypothetical protein
MLSGIEITVAGPKLPIEVYPHRESPMPTEAKLGLLLGIGLTITFAVLFRPKEQPSTAQPPVAYIKGASEVQGQAVSNRK